MNLIAVQSSLKQKISHNLEAGIKDMQEQIDYRSSLYNDVLQLIGRYRDARGQHIQGISSSDEYTLSKNQIRASALALAGALEAADLRIDLHFRDEFHERILIVCHDDGRREYLAQFFPAEYFPNLTYQVGMEFLLPRGFDLVVFDNMDGETPHPPHWVDGLLYRYLTEGTAYVLYLGRHVSLVADFPARAYATNSVFSIYARLRELTEFIKYYRPRL